MINKTILAAAAALTVALTSGFAHAGSYGYQGYSSSDNCYEGTTAYVAPTYHQSYTQTYVAPTYVAPTYVAPTYTYQQTYTPSYSSGYSHSSGY